MSINRLILGDNLEILKTIEADSVDLIYLDPPFFSNRNYEVIWGDSGEIRSFQDRWAGGMSHYIDWLKERVEEMHRILKPTGSIFLHCDWHADAYIRVYVLDKIFGENNFRNEIAWCYASGGVSKKYFAKKHDVIFFYTKSDKYMFNTQYREYSEGTKQRGLTAYKKQMNEKYELNTKGAVMSDWWSDITPLLSPTCYERIGYPTQKPEALLERIIKCASNEGDTVLDPFVGGGTTVAVADRLNRKWLGVDQSVQAIKVTEFRLQKQTDLFTAPYTVQLHKYDYDTLRYKDAFEFESWIIAQCGGTPQNKKGADRGVDGKAADGTPIQVKRSDTIGVNVIKNFPYPPSSSTKASLKRTRQPSSRSAQSSPFLSAGARSRKRRGLKTKKA